MELFDSSELSSAPEKTDYTDYKVMRELDRLMGLLRFAPEESAGGTRYVARCAPDHFVLPLLADHFFERFGKTSWAIIDERRNCMVSSDQGKKPELRRINQTNSANRNDTAGNTEDKLQNGEAKPEQKDSGDDWEGLWKNYHRSINNEERANPQLQKQFMPRRYWKYLPEME